MEFARVDVARDSMYHNFSMHRWINLAPWQQKSVSLDIFNKTCVGIKTVEPYSVSFRIKG